MKYEPVIGLEIHVELNTKTKMFCQCSADYFGKKPNTHTCPVCLGLPGALPYINEEAIKKCIQIGLALNCSVAQNSLFERKNYFYPDLAKGYQISQYRWPLTVNGWLAVESSDGAAKKIRINRAHQEEDTGKLTHAEGETLIDFNRSGVPLVEIVTEPDFTNSSQVKDYAKKLQQLFRYLGVSNADMEKGDMRLEANISVRPVDSKELPNYRVELKNINSFSFMVAAVEYEIKRQITSLENGEKLQQETRGWDQVKKGTYVQRVKEEANDYRYFPDPDLVEIRIKVSDIKTGEIKNSLPELPWDKAKRYIEELGLTKADAKVLVDNRDYAEFFERCVKTGNKVGVTSKQIANYLINQKVEVTDPVEVVKTVQSKGVGVIDNEVELQKLAQAVTDENPQLVELYKKGKTTVIMVLVGAVMKKTAGKADAQKLRLILERLLN